MQTLIEWKLASNTTAVDYTQMFTEIVNYIEQDVRKLSNVSITRNRVNDNGFDIDIDKTHLSVDFDTSTEEWKIYQAEDGLVLGGHVSGKGFGKLLTALEADYINLPASLQSLCESTLSKEFKEYEYLWD